MDNTANRDKAIDRLLRETLPGPTVAAAPGSCVDAETVAAWSDGTLPAADAARVETHLSACPECQTLLAAFARAAPAPQVSESLWQRRRLQWLVPITAAATAVAVWVAIPTNERPGGGLVQSDARSATPAAASQVGKSAPGPPTPAPASPPEVAGRAAVAPAAPLVDELPARLDEVQNEAADRLLPEAEEAAAESVGRREAASPLRSRDAVEQDVVARQGQAKAEDQPEPSAVAERVDSLDQALTAAPAEQRTFALQSRVVAPLEIVSPDEAHRWRILSNAQVDHSTNGGETWASTTIAPAAAFTAGSAPSPLVCWLVGLAGAVQLTTDGTEFQPVPFPESVDLAGVDATSANSATVTAADGRQFRTDDRGQTWSLITP